MHGFLVRIAVAAQIATLSAVTRRFLMKERKESRKTETPQSRRRGGGTTTYVQAGDEWRGGSARYECCRSCVL